MTYYVLAVLALTVITWALVRIKELLEKLLASLGGLRWQLEQMGDRQARIEDRLHDIREHVVPLRSDPWEEDLIAKHSRHPSLGDE